MTTPRRGRRRRVSALLGGAALAGVLAGCSGAASDSRSAMRATEAAPAPSSVTPAATSVPVAREQPPRDVTCDVHTCTLTLRTTGPRDVRALGSTLSLDGVVGTVARLTVGDGKVECRAGESVEAGRLTLYCDDVTADSVQVTAEVG